MTMTSNPSLDDLESLAVQALATIPAFLRDRVSDVQLRVQELPEDEIVAEMGLESPLDLLGLYSGVPFGLRSVSDVPHELDRIFLYRQPILDYWRYSGEELASLVRHVLIHEIGHHFGLSDEDMDRIEEGTHEHEV